MLKSMGSQRVGHDLVTEQQGSLLNRLDSDISISKPLNQMFILARCIGVADSIRIVYL